MKYYTYFQEPQQDYVAVYEWSEMIEVYGKENAEALRNGETIFWKGGYVVNMVHAAMRQVDIALENE